MKNVEIAEGGRGRRLSGTKFILTDKPNSDQMEVWVDEDDRKLARLYATSNGTYYPEEYEAYGFSSVTVSIHGGIANPDLPSIEMPDGTIVPALIPEIEMPDGTILPIDELFPDIPLGDVKIPDTVGEEGSSIVGIDPEDGYTYKVDVDENGNLEVEKVPTDIKVIQDPDKKEYDFGEEINYDGMKIALVDKDGNVVKTKEYPTGTITTDDIDNPEDLPKKTQERDKIKGTWTVKTDLDLGYTITGSGSAHFDTYATQNRIRESNIYDSFDVVIHCTEDGYFGYHVSAEPTTVSWSSQTIFYYRTSDGEKGKVISDKTRFSSYELRSSYTYNGKKVYYGGYEHGLNMNSYNHSPDIPPQQGMAGSIGILAWAALYGQRVAEETVHVGWTSPYTGEVYEDGMTIVTSDPYSEI